MKSSAPCQFLLYALALAIAACGAGDHAAPSLPTPVQVVPASGASGAAGSPGLAMPVTSEGEEPAGFRAVFRVDPKPDTEGIIHGGSPLIVEFDLCGSSTDSGEPLTYLYDWDFDHVANAGGTGDACRQEHKYDSRRFKDAKGDVHFETNVCVVSGDPTAHGPGTYFSCRRYQIALPAPAPAPAKPSGPCGGTLLDPGNGITGCWYTAPALGQTCTQVCAPHGGFDSAASQHNGNAVGFVFWPAKANGSDWVTVECSSTDNNTNWGANGGTPDASFSHQACYVNCACDQ